MAAMAVILNCVLLVSVIIRYHYHDIHGIVHYCLVCDHESVSCYCDCGHSESFFNGNSHCKDRSGSKDDDACALHIDSFYYDDTHHNCKHHCELHYICGCLQWVAVLDGCNTVNCLDDRYYRLYFRDLDSFRITETSVEVTRGPPFIC